MNRFKGHSLLQMQLDCWYPPFKIEQKYFHFEYCKREVSINAYQKEWTDSVEQGQPADIITISHFIFFHKIWPSGLQKDREQDWNVFKQVKWASSILTTLVQRKSITVQKADLKIANMDALEKLHLLQLHTKKERFLNGNQLIFYAILQNRHQSTICYRKIRDIVSFIQQFTVIFKWRFCRCQVEWRSALFRSEISCQISKSNTEIRQNGYVTERNTYAFVFFCY